ncbi:hypothetical protein HDU96_004032, partial [Phlyctochytrium bullatum]
MTGKNNSVSGTTHPPSQPGTTTSSSFVSSSTTPPNPFVAKSPVASAGHGFDDKVRGDLNVIHAVDLKVRHLSGGDGEATVISSSKPRTMSSQNHNIDLEAGSRHFDANASAAQSGAKVLAKIHIDYGSSPNLFSTVEVRGP